MAKKPIKVTFKIRKKEMIGIASTEGKKGLEEASNYLKEYAQDSLNSGPAGTRYFYGFPLNKKVFGSAPGDPPWNQTLALWNSINYKFVRALKTAIGSRLYYAGWLEFGTRRMKARPFMRPALLNNLKKIPDFFAYMFRK